MCASLITLAHIVRKRGDAVRTLNTYGMGNIISVVVNAECTSFLTQITLIYSSREMNLNQTLRGILFRVTNGSLFNGTN